MTSAWRQARYELILLCHVRLSTEPPSCIRCLAFSCRAKVCLLLVQWCLGCWAGACSFTCATWQLPMLMWTLTWWPTWRKQSQSRLQLR